MCGATIAHHEPIFARAGLSPRVRGNPGHLCKMMILKGPIPACAGQPAAALVHANLRRAYPRVCGATAATRSRKRRGRGLSPRVRGNRGQMASLAPMWGPIPACAGQPYGGVFFLGFGGAYPRVCGATDEERQRRINNFGLSPRVRGNQMEKRARVLSPGPIPACAGQPGAPARRIARCRAYPRVCGAT